MTTEEFQKISTRKSRLRYYTNVFFFTLFILSLTVIVSFNSVKQYTDAQYREILNKYETSIIDMKISKEEQLKKIKAKELDLLNEVEKLKIENERLKMATSKSLEQLPLNK